MFLIRLGSWISKCALSFWSDCIFYFCLTAACWGFGWNTFWSLFFDQPEELARAPCADDVIRDWTAVLDGCVMPPSLTVLSWRIHARQLLPTWHQYQQKQNQTREMQNATNERNYKRWWCMYVFTVYCFVFLSFFIFLVLSELWGGLHVSRRLQCSRACRDPART